MAEADAETTEFRFLTVRVDGRDYALPALDVAEIIPLPAAARVPQGPKALLGLANLRGTVLPLVSARALLGRPEAAADAMARAVVLAGAVPVALAVDRVEALVSVAAGRIETGRAALAAEDGEMLRGAFDGGAGVVRILDLPALLAGGFARPARPAGAVARPESVAAVPAAADDREALVTFDVAGQDYALRLDAVQEIVPFPASLVVAPRAEAVLLGVAAHRDGLLPLLSLRGLLGIAGEAPAAGKVIVTLIGGVAVGLVADGMGAILRAEAGRIEPAPAMLAARSGGEARVQAIFRAPGGRLVSILAPELLFREDVMQRLRSAGLPADRLVAEIAGGGTRPFLIFRLGREEFGLPIAVVDEVALVPERIARLPKTPKFLEGVINLRGEVLPVIDQRRRFDMPAAGGEERRLVVVRTASHRAGLIVDAVSEVLRLPEAAIAEMPAVGEAVARLVAGVANLPASGRMVMLLDPGELLSRTERALLDTFTAGAAARITT